MQEENKSLGILKIVQFGRENFTSSPVAYTKFGSVDSLSIQFFQYITVFIKVGSHDPISI